MLKLETRQDLKSLIANQVRESSEIEYKSSPAVEKSDRRKLEIAKDVSAIANANGGQIVYGMVEDDHLPSRLDDGIDPKQFSGLWFEQAIQQNVSPNIEGLVIKEVSLENGNVAVVLTIPASVGRGAHQLRHEGRYYRRRNFRNDIMEDYEVREVMRRASTPILTSRVSTSKRTIKLQRITPDRTNHVPFLFHVTNLSEQPAEYAALLVYLDPSLTLQDSHSFGQRPETELVFERKCNIYRAELGIPVRAPIFKGAEVFVGSISAHFAGKVPNRIFLGTKVMCPGYSESRIWPVQHDDGELRLHEAVEWNEKWGSHIPGW